MINTTCIHHNDSERAACPVCLVATLTAERDQLRALLVYTDQLHDESLDDIKSERNQLRAELERLTPYVSKAVLTNGGTMLCSPQVGVVFNEMQGRAVLDAAMKVRGTVK